MARALALGWRQPVLCADTTTDPFAVARDARHALLLARLAPRSALAVPLRARGQTLGVMTLAWSKTVRQYTAEDVALADEFARHAAVAVDNARLYREAQRAISARDQFLSIASHELKTPLTSLLGYAELLLEELHALVETGERKTVRVVLGLVPPRPEPELDAAA